MKGLALVGLGLAAGMLLATWLRTPSSCCQTVAQGVRNRVADEFGEGVAGLGDLFHVWEWTPGLVSLLQPKGAA